MSLPLFFATGLQVDHIVILDADVSRHVAQVLRMPTGSTIRLTDGAGNLAIAVIEKADKHACEVRIKQIDFNPAPSVKITIAISLIKNHARFEWFLEKAAELGISEIIPLICARTEKQHVKDARWINILKSAMLQSGQSRMVKLHQPASLSALVKQTEVSDRFIAYCGETAALLSAEPIKGNSIILIGPEGDFTSEEVSLATSSGFVPVSLGDTRLRTETAGIYAAVMLKSKA